jgi:membrane associated rhomboid family serine protease
MSLSTTRPVGRRATWAQAAIGSIGFVALLWVVEAIDAATGDALNQYGVQPRDGEGLLGIIWSPLLHLDFAHLGANSVPALVLLFLTLLSGIARGVLTTAIIWVVGGLGVWVFSPSNTVTIGASGLVFGWLVYLMVRGFVSRRVGEIVLGVVLLLVYGGILLGVLPGQPGVSWQGHLFGSVGGLLAAWWVSGPRRRTAGR